MPSKNVNVSTEPYSNQDYEAFRDYDRFKFLLKEMSSELSSAESLLDIGCAKGEFIYLAKELFPSIAYHGLEFSAELVARALRQPELQGVQFYRGDACSFELDRTFDITLMSGVLSIFDDISKPLSQMLKATKSGGTGYIFGAFNQQDIDVLVRFRDNTKRDISHKALAAERDDVGSSRATGGEAFDQLSEQWESGWNLFSLETVKGFLKGYVSELGCSRFEISRSLIPKESPVASYTVDRADGGRLILTGGNIVRDFYLIYFRKN